MTSHLNIKLSVPNKNICASVSVPVSKSEVNRLLILQALSGGKIKLQNTSTANDVKVIERALSSHDTLIDVEDAGTAMRFLTAFFCVLNEHKVLCGTERMHERPMGELVSALRELGFDIRYLGKKEFPPIEILPVDFSTLKSEAEISGNVSSQFISALMLIGAFLPNGLRITILGKKLSESYIKLTASLLEKCGIYPVFLGENEIWLSPQSPTNNPISAGGDWTNASYWYAFAALSQRSEITIHHLQFPTAQGDVVITEWGKRFGIETRFLNNKIVLVKNDNPSFLSEKTGLFFDFINHPDLAQTIIVLCAALNREAVFTGLQSLRIKETDRIVALQQELKKCGVELYNKDTDTFSLRGQFHPPVVSIETYNDHRMAMAFAPLSMLSEIEIEKPDVVRKSYPDFWEQVSRLCENAF